LKPNVSILVSAAKTVAIATRDARFVHVKGYRLNDLDGVHKVASGEWFEADDDEAAIEVARKMMDGHDCELWQGRRRVARINKDARS